MEEAAIAAVRVSAMEYGNEKVSVVFFFCLVFFKSWVDLEGGEMEVICTREEGWMAYLGISISLLSLGFGDSIAAHTMPNWHLLNREFSDFCFGEIIKI